MCDWATTTISCVAQSMMASPVLLIVSKYALFGVAAKINQPAHAIISCNVSWWGPIWAGHQHLLYLGLSIIWGRNVVVTWWYVLVGGGEWWDDFDKSVGCGGRQKMRKEGSRAIYLPPFFNLLGFQYEEWKHILDDHTGSRCNTELWSVPQKDSIPY